MAIPARIALTAGEPAGVGPDLLVHLAQRPHHAELIVVCEPELLSRRAKLLNLPLKLRPFAGAATPAATEPGVLTCIPVETSTEPQLGQLDPANAEYVLETLTTAARLCLDGTADAVVTGPLHKGVINDAGIGFTGHTEFLAELSNSEQPVMLLATPEMRVALATTHLPLRQVADALTEQRLAAILTVLARDLRRWSGIAAPRIQVCGLNPHAGESGHLGNEEITLLEPAIADARRQGINVTGPVPADTAFLPERLNDIDVTLAMYHDQGLPVLKHQGFGKSVNITLGLPFIRTSVDHGTALTLAGTEKVDPTSLFAALTTAETMIACDRRG